MQHRKIARVLSIFALACTAGVIGLAPAQPEPEPKKKIVLRLRTDAGAVMAQIVTDEDIKDLLISEVELINVDGQLTGRLGPDKRGSLSLMTPGATLAPVRLGLTTEIIPMPLAVHLDMSPVEGLLVTNLVDGLAAAKGGLMRYDVLVELDGQSPVTQQTLRRRVQVCKPGDPITLSIVRKGETLEITVVAEEQDPASETVISWVMDSTRRYVTGTELIASEFVIRSEDGLTGSYVWTDESGEGTAHYRVKAIDALPSEVITGIVSTRQADGGLLLDVTPAFRLPRDSSTTTLGDRPRVIGVDDSGMRVQVDLIDPSDPVGNLRAQITAMKRQLAALEALVDQLEPSRD